MLLSIANIATPPPVPTDLAEAARVEHTRLRVRMLAGEHAADVAGRLRRSLAAVRAAAIGDPDLSSNPFAAGSEALATLYDPTDTGDFEPVLEHPDTTVVTAMSRGLSETGIWTMSPRIQRDAIGLRENLVRGDSRIENGRPVVSWRTVTPDLVEVIPHAHNVSEPAEVREWRVSTDAAGRACWVREVWSVVGGVGSHRILDDRGQDVSEFHGLPEGGLVGEDYPCVDVDGRPELPYVLVHAARTGRLWDPRHGIEVVDGSIWCGVHLTQYGHLLRNASWAQRYTIGADVEGAEAVDADTGAARDHVAADPASVLRLRGDGETQNPIAGQWSTPTDPEKVIASVLAYERRLHARQGLDPADAQRISGDPRSGYALKISQESKDRHALAYAPIFTASDRRIVRLYAILVNNAVGFAAYPTTGWSLEHAPIRAIRRRAAMADREGVLALLDKRLITPAEARARLTGETLEVATQRVAEAQHQAGAAA